MVVVDAEEEFDWTRQFSRENTSVRSMGSIGKAQQIFDEYGVKPVYAVSYPVVSQPDGYKPLQEIVSDGRCVIGAHLHPWVTPPFEEPIGRFTTYAGNLPPDLERAKLHVLAESIAERFGSTPTVYKAGRYGLGPHTAEILEQLGFAVDLSVCPYMSFSEEGGPDFRLHSPWPYWFGREKRLLELPLTVGFTGLLRQWGGRLHNLAVRSPLAWIRAAGILARLRMVDRIWLSPEGFELSDQRRLIHALHHDGLRVFTFAFHSPSLEPGNTPYVRSVQDLEQFLARCRKFLDFFMVDLDGSPTTPLELKAELSGAAQLGPEEEA
jgi:hypothetical protein